MNLSVHRPSDCGALQSAVLPVLRAPDLLQGKVLNS